MYLNSGKPLHFIRTSALLIVVIIAFIDTSRCCEQNLTPPNDECVCPGNSLRLTCTAVGLGNTIWRVFNDRQCTIQLRHQAFTDPTPRSCEGVVDGPTVRSLSVMGECYTSQLTVMVTPDLNGTNVSCVYDNARASTEEFIGFYLITLISEPLPPPDDVRLTNITSEGLVFSWSSVASNCSAITYNISSNNCGDCPVNTTSTTATCHKLQLTPNMETCELSVQTIICDRIGSIHSDPLITMLPSALKLTPTVKIFPKYQQNTTLLISFGTIIDKIAPIPISEVNVAVEFFTVMYSIGGSVCESRMIELNGPACTGDVCNVTSIILSDSNCTVEADLDIIVTISATSGLGTGQESQSKVDGTYINFVTVTNGTNSIICTFVNQQDRSRKSCNATYAPCGEAQQPQIAYNDTSESQLVLNLTLFDQIKYCYIVNASNDTISVLIEGSTTATTQVEPNRKNVLPSGGIVGIVLLLLAVILILVVIQFAAIPCWNSRKKSIDIDHGQQMEVLGRKVTHQADSNPQEYDPVSESKDNKDSAQHITVTADAQEQIDHEPDVSELLDQDTGPKTIISSDDSRPKLESDNQQKLSQPEPQKPTNEPMKNQNTLNQIPKEENQADNSEIPTDLEEIDKNDYKVHEIDKECGLLEFFNKNGIEFYRGHTFYEFQNKTEDIDRNSRIILINKSSDKYFSGKGARKMVGLLPTPKETDESKSEFENEIKKPDHLLDKYRIFIQDRGPGSRHLPMGSTILIQDEDLEVVPPGKFSWLPVEEDCELLTFIESHGLVFHRGNAFYEFSHKSEDITGKKEIILMDVKTEILHNTGERTKIMLGVPGKGIRNPYADKKKWRVFVQSSCTGNRHLDKDTMVLYEKDKKSSIKNSPSTELIQYKEEVEDDFEVIVVAKDSSLREYIEEKKGENSYDRGCSYYELTNKDVDIDGSKEVIFMDKERNLFTGHGQAAARKTGAPGINLRDPGLPAHSKVFVRCNGPGHNVYIKKDTSVLYKDPMISPHLIPVNIENFRYFKVGETCELRTFVEQELQNIPCIHTTMSYKEGNAYFQFTCATEDIDNKKEVLLLDKEGKLFTGPVARRMIGAPGIGIPKPGPDFEYEVFIQNRSRGSRCLIKGSVLYYKID